MTREELWDAFTDFDEDKMADVAMNAINVRVFKKDDFDDEMRRADMSPTDIAEMIETSTEFSIFEKEEWIVFDVDAQEIKSDFDLLYLLSDYEDEITDALEEDESLLE
nr:MAG TPA: hypothetical protein [Caudoviricetes sp.]